MLFFPFDVFNYKNSSSFWYNIEIIQTRPTSREQNDNTIFFNTIVNQNAHTMIFYKRKKPVPYSLLHGKNMILILPVYLA